MLGLGAMGLPMASHLATTMTVHGFDVSPERLDLARDAGIVPFRSAAEACDGVSVVVVGVRDGTQLDAVLFETDGAVESLAAGSVVVVTSTVGAQLVVDVGARVGEKGIHLVDAPVSGGPVRAGEGDLLIMVGATPTARVLAADVLDELASTLTDVGGVGAGQQLKTINQLLCGIHTAAAAEALVLAHRLGIDLRGAIDVLDTGAAASFMLADRGPRMAARLTGQTPDLRSRLDVIGKDMGIVGDLAREYQVATPLAAAAEQLFRIGEAAGHGAQDDSVVVTLLAQDAPW